MALHPDLPPCLHISPGKQVCSWQRCLICTVAHVLIRILKKLGEDTCYFQTFLKKKSVVKFSLTGHGFLGHGLERRHFNNTAISRSLMNVSTSQESISLSLTISLTASISWTIIAYYTSAEQFNEKK